MSCLSDALSQTLSRNESARSRRDKLDKDLETYIRAADNHLDDLEAEARAKAAREGKEEAEIDPKDPLDFWCAQVGVICYLIHSFF